MIVDGAFSLRPATRDDVGILSQLHARCFPKAWGEAEFLSFFDRGSVDAWLAFDGECPVGFVICWMIGHESEVLSVGVLPDYRGRKLGLHLCEASMQSQKAKGVSVLHLEVGIGNHAARKLYHSLGFEMVHRRKDYYSHPDGSREDAITMRCDW